MYLPAHTVFQGRAEPPIFYIPKK